MELKDQVCSLELAKQLAALDVGSAAEFYWCYHNAGVWDLEKWHRGHANWYAAYTVAELGELLPDGSHVLHTSRGWAGFIDDVGFGDFTDTEADAKAQLLVIHLEGEAEECKPPSALGGTIKIEYEIPEPKNCVDVKPAPGMILKNEMKEKDWRLLNDKVNHPDHYTAGGIEVIDFIEDKGLDYHRGNAIKYISRAGYKGTYIEDLKKARWYCNRVIENDNGEMFALPSGGGRYQVWEFVEAKELDYNLGCAITYIVNAGDSFVDDLQEACRYIDRAIQKESNGD